MCSTTAVHFAEQVYISCQLLRCVLHLILKQLGLCFAQSFGEPTPYRLKVSGWIVGPNHSKGVGSGGNNGVVVEALEALPRRLASFDDDVWARRPTIGLRSHFWFNAVEHWSNPGNYGVELVPLGPGLLHQHIKLCLDPSTVVCKHYKVPSGKVITPTITSTKKYSPFRSFTSLSAHPDSFAFSSQSCSRAWRSWPSSASCSTSTTGKDIAIQQYKALLPI